MYFPILLHSYFYIVIADDKIELLHLSKETFGKIICIKLFISVILDKISKKPEELISRNSLLNVEFLLNVVFVNLFF